MREGKGRKSRHWRVGGYPDSRQKGPQVTAPARSGRQESVPLAWDM